MKAGFDAGQHGLKALRVEVWQGFLYVSLSESPTASVAERLGPLTNNVVGRFDMAEYSATSAIRYFPQHVYFHSGLDADCFDYCVRHKSDQKTI